MVGVIEQNTAAGHTPVPGLRFKDDNGRDFTPWVEKKIGHFLSESKITGTTGDVANKLTVKLWRKGIVVKNEVLQGSINTQYYVRKKGQLMYGKLDFLNCAFGLVPVEYDGYESTTDSPAFDIEGINSSFLLEYIARKDFYLKYGNRADGTRRAKRIQPNVFFEMPILSPSIKEQQKIATFLSALDTRIDAQSDKIKALSEQKKGLMQKIFAQELRFTDENGRGFAPWVEKKLELVLHIENGYPFKSEFFTSNVTGVPLIRIRDIKAKEMNTYYTGDFDEKYMVENGDVIIGMDGEFVISKWDKGSALLNQRVMRIKNNVDSDLEFLHQVLKSVVKKIEDIAPQTTVKHLSNKDIYNSVVAMPSLQEQQKIAKFLSRLDERIAHEQDKLDAYRDEKKAFMQKLFPSAAKSAAVYESALFNPNDKTPGKASDTVQTVEPVHVPKVLRVPQPVKQ